MKLTNEIFEHLARCNKAGFFFAKKNDLLEKDYFMKRYLQNKVKESILKIVQSEYLDSLNDIQSNRQFITENGESAIADIIIKSSGKNILIAIIAAKDEPNWIQMQSLAYTYYLVTHSGVRIDTVAYLIPLEKTVRPGAIAIGDLKIKECTKEVVRNQPKIEKKIKKFREIIRNNSQPTNKIDMCCIKPDVCAFKQYCESVEFPKENSLMELNGIDFHRKLQLKWKGVIDLRQLLPNNVTLSEGSKNQITYTEINKILIKSVEIKKWVNRVGARKFIFFLDFEYDTSLYPLGNSNNTFDLYPFIYTVYFHDISTGGTGHFQSEVVPNLSANNIKIFTKKLVEHFSYNHDGRIIVSQINKVKKCLLNLSLVSPESKLEMEFIASRLEDIRSIFVNQLYYDPKFKGSTYLKKIIPIMCPDITYEKLKIKSGIQAQFEFRQMVTENKNVIQIQEDLKQYSKMDAFALMKTYQFLKALVKA